MRCYHLFAGGGGGLLADALLGHTPVGACEIEDDPRAVLAKRWPGMPIHRDVRTVTGEEILRDCGPVDIIAGGWPCQDISIAGKNAGMAKDSGTRSGLAWEYLRVVAEVRPKFVFGENVQNIVSAAHRPHLDAFLGELERLGYGGAWCMLSASQVGAPHRRKRFWLLAERDRPGGFREVSTKHLPEWPKHSPMPIAWPTPDVHGLNNRVGVSEKSGDGLGWAAKADAAAGELWATPRVSGSGTAEFVRDDGKLRNDLQTQTVMAECVQWPTPRANKTTHEDPLSWRASHDKGGVSTPPLDTAAAMEEVALATARPSPRASDCGHGGPNQRGSKGDLMLPSAVCQSEAAQASSVSAPWPTPTVQDGENAAGVSQFSRNTLPLNAEVFREIVRGLTPERIKEIIGDRRLNADWVENLMGWPVGHTDLGAAKVKVPMGSGGEYLFPAGRWVAQRSHEAPRITSVKPRSPEAKARNARLKMLGNGQTPQCAAAAFKILFSALPRIEIKATH